MKNVPRFFFFFTRASYHMGISNLIEKCIKNAKKSTISDDLLQGDSPQTFDNFDILGSNSNKFKFLIKESLLVKCDKPVLNKTAKPYSLDLFD